MNEEILSEAAFQELIAEAKETFKWHDDFKKRFDAERRRNWEKLAGPLALELLSSRESAEHHLENPHPKKRLAALLVLLDHWKPNVHLAERCEKLAFTDPDSQMRGVALSGLSKCYSETHDTRILRLLANIVGDERQQRGFRETAYFGLFFVDGSDARSLPDPDFRFPDDVDWDFVSKFTPDVEIVKHPA